MAALIEVSGVRRSCPTAESSAVRSSVASAWRCACGGLGRGPLLAQGQQRLAADGLQQPPVGGGQRRGRVPTRCRSALDRDVDIGLVGPAAVERAGRGDAAPPDAPARPSRRSSSATERSPNASRTFSSSRGSGSAWVSTVRAKEASSAASVRARAACWARRAARSTTSATSTATTHHGHQGDHVLGLGDGQRVQRRGEEEVQQQPAEPPRPAAPARARRPARPRSP